MKNLICFLFISTSLISCGKSPQYNDSIPEHDSFTIESAQVSETRVVNVWTPPDYVENSDPLPVIYMLDGGIKEDFPHIANTIAELVKMEKIAPITDGAKEFRLFISDELFSEIGQRYRTTNHIGIIGESVAGLFIMETLMKRPDMFDFYIAMDPSLWWNDNHLVKTSKGYLAKFPSKEIRLWYAGSGVEDISPYTNQLAGVLKSEAPESPIWNYSDEPNEKHNTVFRATKEKALIWALPIARLDGLESGWNVIEAGGRQFAPMVRLTNFSFVQVTAKN